MTVTSGTGDRPMLDEPDALALGGTIAAHVCIQMADSSLADEPARART